MPGILKALSALQNWIDTWFRRKVWLRPSLHKFLLRRSDSDRPIHLAFGAAACIDSWMRFTKTERAVFERAAGNSIMTAEPGTSL